jgi:D-sedoheptulose 7-phosphate isomerase
MHESEFITRYIDQSATVIASLHSLAPQIEAAAQMWVDAILAGKKVIFCGNGGSAADAQHLAAELMGRFLFDRDPMAALSLTVDTSALTAIGNDYGYENIFSRQLKGIGREGDVLVGLSTSGNSLNVVKAFDQAKAMGIRTIGLTGEAPGKMASNSNLVLAIPHRSTSHIQEGHIVIGHLICALTEARLCSPNA